MGSCHSITDDLRETSDLEDSGTPMGGTEFADFIIRKMRAHKQGPSQAEGEFLIYLAIHQGTPADESSTRWGTPREYAVTHRLAVWTRFIIDQLGVQPPIEYEDAMKTARYADRRAFNDLSDHEKILFEDVENSNVDPSSARFFDPEHYSRHRTNDPSAEDQVKVLTRPFRKQADEDEMTARSPGEVLDEPMPRSNDPLKLTLWMLALGQKVGVSILEKIGGSLLWDFFSVCMQIAKVVKRWNGREEERTAWRNFMEAHRRVVQSVRALERFVESGIYPWNEMDVNKPRTETDVTGPPNEKMGEILARKAREIMKIVDSMREEIKKANNSMEPTHHELVDLIMRKTSELLDKRESINLQIECMVEWAKDKKRVGALEESFVEMKKEVSALKQSDKEWKKWQDVLSGGSTVGMDQRMEAVRSMLEYFDSDRARKANRGNHAEDDVEGASPSAAPAGGVEESTSSDNGGDGVDGAASRAAPDAAVEEAKPSDNAGDDIDGDTSSAAAAGSVEEPTRSDNGGDDVDGVVSSAAGAEGVEEAKRSDNAGAAGGIGEPTRSDKGEDGVGGVASSAAAPSS